MASVIPFREASLPDMTVVEVSIIVALLRRGPTAPDGLAPVLADWFAMPVRSDDLAPSVRRMTRRGWLARRGGGTLAPTPSAYQPTQVLYAGFIRLLGRESEPHDDDGQLNLLGDHGKGTAK